MAAFFFPEIQSEVIRVIKLLFIVCCYVSYSIEIVIYSKS